MVTLFSKCCSKSGYDSMKCFKVLDVGNYVSGLTDKSCCEIAFSESHHPLTLMGEQGEQLHG